MTFRLEYDCAVRRLIPASVAGFLLGVVFVSQSYAQSNGAASAGMSSGPASGSAGHGGSSAAAPSGSAHGQSGPSGHVPGSGTTHSGSGGNHSGSGGNHGKRPHHHSGESIPYLGYVIAVPYAVDLGTTDDNSDADDDSDAEYQGGPTVFDRRGSGADSYVPPVSDVPMPHAAEQAEPEAAEDEAPAEEPQPPTVLVFKDGHDIEVGNYAIVGETLFDLTLGHARRVALADLDLEATRKRNDDRGVVFELPASPQAN